MRCGVVLNGSNRCPERPCSPLVRNLGLLHVPGTVNGRRIPGVGSRGKTFGLCNLGASPTRGHARPPISELPGDHIRHGPQCQTCIVHDYGSPAVKEIGGPRATGSVKCSGNDGPGSLLSDFTRSRVSPFSHFRSFDNNFLRRAPSRRSALTLTRLARSMYPAMSRPP